MSTDPVRFEERTASIEASEVIAVVLRQWPRTSGASVESVERIESAPSATGPPPSEGAESASSEAADSPAYPFEDLARRLARAYGLTDDAARREIELVRVRLLVARRAREAARGR